MGYFVANDNNLDPLEAVSPKVLVSSVVTGPFTIQNGGLRLRLITAYDRVSMHIHLWVDAHSSVG